MAKQGEHNEQIEDDDPYAGSLLDTAIDSSGMSFLEHLEEFRWTVGRSLLAFTLGITPSYFFYRRNCRLFKVSNYFRVRI